MKILSHPRMVRTGFTLGVLLLILTGLTGFALLTRTTPDIRTEGPGVEPLLVEAQSIQWQTGYTVTRWFVGRVEASQESDVGFEIAGLVSSIPVEEGQLVKTGDIVAQLDAQRLEARRDELHAARAQAQARYDLAELTLERATLARQRDAVSDQEWDEVEKAFQAAAADLSRAAAAVQTVEVDLAKTIITSPFDAVVATRYIDEGRVVNAGTPIVRLLQRTAPEVRIGVGGTSIDAISVGQHFNVQIRDRMVDGEVTGILPVRDRTGRGVDVVITLDAEIDGIRSGDLARVQIERPVAEDGFWVPVQALTEGSRGLWSVYILDDDSGHDHPLVHRADVEVLHEDTDRVYARGAVTDGAHIVANGLHRVSPGMAVRRADSAEQTN